jgi:hypothetical protein
VSTCFLPVKNVQGEMADEAHIIFAEIILMLAPVENSQEKNTPPAKKWLKRIGIAGFLFFLLKGLAWLAVIWLGIDVLGGC